MKKQVVGFLFSNDAQDVLLIEKNRPEWQKGLLNGVGGKCEDGETPFDAMVREFREETGLEVSWWDKFAVINHFDTEIHFYYGYSAEFYNAKSVTDEKLMTLKVSALLGNSERLIPSLVWLIPMALSMINEYHEYYVIETS